MAAETVSPGDDLRAAGIELAVHATGGLLVLLVPTALSIYKPRGLTPYGQRVQQQQARSSRANNRLRQRPFLDSNAIASKLSGESLTITLRRAHVFAIVIIILVLHSVILHLTGIGLGGH